LTFDRLGEQTNGRPQEQTEDRKSRENERRRERERESERQQKDCDSQYRPFWMLPLPTVNSPVAVQEQTADHSSPGGSALVGPASLDILVLGETRKDAFSQPVHLREGEKGAQHTHTHTHTHTQARRHARALYMSN
jgi:hypothetical protein